jgi:methyl-accepting chemotaxis protein
MSCFSYSYTSNIVEEKTNKGLMQAFNQMNISISSMITEIENVSEQIYMNSILQKIVGISYRDILYSKQYEDYKELYNFLNVLEQNPNIEKIELYLKNQSVFSQDYRYIFQLDSSRAKFFDEKIGNSHSDKHWFIFNKIPQEISYGPYDWLYSSNNGAIFFVRKIKQLDAINNECGLLIMKINQNIILDMMKEINITENIKVYLIDNSKVVLCRDYNDTFVNVIKNDNGFEFEDSYRKVKYGNEEFLSFSKKISNINWCLRGIIPLKELKHEGINIRNFLILITLISCIFTAIISTLITKSMSKNINIIIKKMENIDTFSTEKEIKYKDEIGKLEDHFIQMVYTLKSLIKENYEVK